MGSVPRSILITGGSSGIGAALALHYAAPGVTLFLSGRDSQRLDDVAGLCRARGASVHGRVIDVRAADDMRHWIDDCDHIAPLDLVIANAGISGGTGGTVGQGEGENQVRGIFDINLNGVINTVHPALAAMRPRGRGQVALMASLASFTGWPGAPAYSASKAAVRLYGEALHGPLKRDGIIVSVICPGFVKSRMTDANDYPMPFFMQTDPAAAVIARGLAAGRARIAFPFPAYLAARLVALMPPALAARILTKLPEKPASPL